MQERIGAVYDFVRDEIAFGYNGRTICRHPAYWPTAMGSATQRARFADGIAAQRRRCPAVSRFHHRQGAPKGRDHRDCLCQLRRIIHSWVEVWFEAMGLPQGFILDAQDYLRSLQRRFPGGGDASRLWRRHPDLSAPDVEWRGEDTFIQKEGASSTTSGL